MADNLKKQTISSLLWDSFGHLVNMGITFVMTVVLARLLDPEMFGMIGMIMVFTTIAHMLANFGFGSALIQDQQSDNIDISTVFYFNIGLGISLTVLLILMAPLIARFFDEQQLTLLIKFMSITLIISSFGIIPTSLLIKRMDFKSQVIARSISAIVAGIVGISMALKGFGVWSIATQILVLNTMQTVLIWYLSKWTPTMVFRLASLRRIFGYSSKVFGSQVIATLFSKFDNLLIGKIFSAGELGYYTRGKRFYELPTQSMSFALRVFFPALSRIQNDRERIKNIIKKTVGIIAFFIFPLMVGLIVLADPMIRLLLTDRWLPTVQYIQVLSLIGFAYPLSSLNLNIIRAIGKANVLLNLEIVKQINMVVLMIVGSYWGVFGLVMGRTLAGIIGFLLNTHYCGKEIEYSLMEQIKDILPYLFLSIVMGAIVYIAGSIYGSNYVLKFFSGVIIAPISYYLLCRIFNLPAVSEALTIIKTNLFTKRVFVS